MNPLALVNATGGRVDNAQGVEVSEGELPFAQPGCQKLNQALKKNYCLCMSHRFAHHKKKIALDILGRRRLAQF